MRLNNNKTLNWRAWEDPTMFSINILTWAFKEFDKKNAWEPWTKEEKELIKEQFNITQKSFPGFLNQYKPGKGRVDNGLFKAIVRAREIAWILKEKDINLNIDEFIDYTDCWKVNEKKFVYIPYDPNKPPLINRG